MQQYRKWLVVPVMLLLLSGLFIGTASAHAATGQLGSAQTASHQLNQGPKDFGSCVWYYGTSTSRTNQYGYVLHIEIDYQFDSYSGACGVMRAIGYVTVPAYRTGGNFTVNLATGGAGINAYGSAPNNTHGYSINSGSAVPTSGTGIYCVNGASINFYGAGGSNASLGTYCQY